MLIGDSQGGDAVKRMQMLDAKKTLLASKNDEYKSLVDKEANARRDYHIEYAKALTIFKSEGKPVTIIKELVRGNKAVADLEFQYILAAAITRACLESMKDVREALGADRSILTYLRSEKDNG